MLAYGGPIIDAHHHLWPYGRGRHQWIDAGVEGGEKALPMGDVGALRRDVLPEHYWAAAEGCNIVATVHVEGGWQGGPPGEETTWLDTLDRGTIAARHVFAVDLAAADASDRLDVEAAHPRAAGVRDVLAWHPEPNRSFVEADKMGHAAWRSGLAALFERDLVFELMIFPWQMDDAARLIDGFPNGRFVLDHCGSPVDRSEAGMRDWADGLSRLSERENLVIKASNPFAYDHDWTIDSLRPVVGHCIEAFGPARTMFGSDFPVSELHAPFAKMMSAYRALTADLSADEQADFFCGTAARTYRTEKGR